MAINKKQIVLILVAVVLMFLIYEANYRSHGDGLYNFSVLMQIAMLWLLVGIAATPLFYFLRTKNLKNEAVGKALDEAEEIVFRILSTAQKSKDVAIEQILQVKQKFSQIKDMLK